MRFLSLFSGIEAASVAWHPLGWECAAVAEVEKFPCAVLKHHYPHTPNLGDVTKIAQEQIESLGQIDVVIFGFPCQDLSVAGKRKGLENADGTLTRSGLFFHAEQISRWAKARWTVAENVPGLFSSNEGRDFATVVGELAGSEFDVPGEGWRSAGVALGPRGLVEWCVLDAQYFGLAQRRKRVFLVRDSGTQWQHRPPLFLKPPSMWRDTAPRRQTRERVAPTLESRTNAGGGGRGTDFLSGGGLASAEECDSGVIPIQEIGKRQSGTPMNGVGHGQLGDPMYTLQAGAVHGIAHSLKARHDGSEDGIGRGVPLVCGAVSSKWAKGTGGPSGDEAQNLVPEVAWALQERDSKGSDSSTKDGHLIPISFSSKDSGNDCQEDLAPTLRSGNEINGNANGGIAPAVAFQQNQLGEVRTGEVAGTLNQNSNASGRNTPMVNSQTAVRRLTPEECEALQGFPKFYTKIDDKTADGPRYKALGNSFAVPVVKWIGQQIEFFS